MRKDVREWNGDNKVQDLFAWRWESQPGPRRVPHDPNPLPAPPLVPFVEIDGRPAGVALAVPNLNEAIHDLNGKLFPFGFIKLFWRLKVRRVRTGRLLLLGIRKEYRTRRYAGLAYLLCDEIYHQAHKRAYQWGEFSWTLEENRPIHSLITKI